MRGRMALFGTIGVVATGFGIGMLVVPEFLLGIGPVETLNGTLENTKPKTLGLVGGVAVSLYLLLAARSRPAPETIAAASSADTRYDDAITRPPEAVTTDRRSIAGVAVEDEIESAIEHGKQPLQSLRSDLLEIATTVYAERAGVAPQSARRAITSGEWTSDPRATVFLADESGPDPSVGMRLRLWLAPERERRRRIERTITAIEQLEGQA